MDMTAGATHYMTFPHQNAGVAFANWTRTLFCNGQQRPDIHIEMREQPTGVYIFSFVNDSTDESIWTLTVWETLLSSSKYVECWRVKQPIVEQNVKQIRARAQARGDVH